MASLLLLAILVLALAGAAEGAIASSGGGLASSISGTGTAFTSTGISAGHSAIALREAEVSLSGVGSLSASQSGTDAAIDPVNGASVSVSGSTVASVTISGSLSGTASAYADAIVQARSDQSGFGEEVGTLIGSALEFSAGTGMTVSGRASSSGKASASGTWPDTAISSSVSGSTSASGTVKGGSNGAGLYANAEIGSGAQTIYGGEFGDTHAVVESSAEMGGTGSGSFTLNANGRADAESDVYSGAITSTSSGQTSGSASFRDTGNGGGVDTYSEIGSSSTGGTGLGGQTAVSQPFFPGTSALIGVYSSMGGGDDTFTGSSSLFASGTATQTGSGFGPTLLSVQSGGEGTTPVYSASGSVSGSLGQSGDGSLCGEAIVAASQIAWGYESYYPVGTDEEGVRWFGIDVSPEYYYHNGAFSEIGSYAEAESDSSRYSATATLNANGKAVASGAGSRPAAVYDPPISAPGLTATTSGSSSSSLTSRGYGDSYGGAVLIAGALYDEDIHVWAGPEGDDGPVYPPINLYIAADNAAMSMLYTEADSDAASSMIATSATGKAGATSSFQFGGYGLGDVPVGNILAETAASGTVSGNVKGAGGEAATASGIWGMSATGPSLTWDGAGEELQVGLPQEQILNFAITDTGLLTASAVSNDGSGTTTAGGKANGNAKSLASMTGVDIETDIGGNPVTDRFTISSSDSGLLTSDMSAKDGEGGAIAYVRSGNTAGQLAPGVFGVASDNPGDLYTGIHTEAEGAGHSPGSRVSGSASVTNGVSEDSGSYVKEVYDPIASETLTIFTATTSNHLADPARSEFTVREGYHAEASTDAWAFSSAVFDILSGGQSDAYGGFEVYAEGDQGAPGTTARATVRPVNLYAVATAVAGTPGPGDSTAVRMNGGSGSAYVKTQPPNMVTASESATMILPAADATGRAVDAGTDTDAIGNPNYANAWISLAASNHIPAPVPFFP